MDSRKETKLSMKDYNYYKKILAAFQQRKVVCVFKSH